MLRKFNSFIEKWMALVTPTCLLLGVCFPDIAKCGLPYVPAVFAFMTFAGAFRQQPAGQVIFSLEITWS